MTEVTISMTSVESDAVSVAEAARLLGMTTRETYDLVFTRQLKSVAAPSGRRVIPRAAIGDWKRQHTSAPT